MQVIPWIVAVLECLPYQHQESNPGKITYSFVINIQYHCMLATLHEIG